MSYLPVPPIASMLLSRKLPAWGGNTWAASMVAAYENLPAALKERVKTLKIKHDGTRDSGGNVRKGVKDDPNPQTAAGYPHPAVIRDPGTGKPALFLGRRPARLRDGPAGGGIREAARRAVAARLQADQRLRAQVEGRRRADLEQLQHHAQARRVRQEHRSAACTAARSRARTHLSPTSSRAHVLILGCGFAGLWAAQALRKAPVEVTVLDRTNHHLFSPLLYQVATAGLSAPSVAGPIRHILAGQRNATVLLGDATGIVPEQKQVLLEDGAALAYDQLIVATGTTHSYFGHDDWAPFAPGLKTLEDALEIRRRVLLAFERAERETDAAQRAAWLTFVVIGGGATGVELAGTFAEIARHTLRGEFRRIDPHSARVVLVEGTDRVLPAYPARPFATRRSSSSSASA